MRLKKYNAPLSTTTGSTDHDIMDEIKTLHGIRYKKKLPMLRLKKSVHHPHVLKDLEEDEENIYKDAELTSPFGSMLSRSTRIWNPNKELLSSTLEGPNHLLTSLMEDLLCQDINGGSAFSRCL